MGLLFRHFILIQKGFLLKWLIGHRPQNFDYLQENIENNMIKKPSEEGYLFLVVVVCFVFLI